MIGEAMQSVLEQDYAPMTLDEMSVVARKRRCLREFEFWVSLFLRKPKCYRDLVLCVALWRLGLYEVKQT